MSMASSDTSSDAAAEREGTSSAVQRLHQVLDSDVLHEQGDVSSQLARFRAARQRKATAAAARQSERKAGALAVGSATEELRREQRRCHKAVKRAERYNRVLDETRSLLKQQEYINGKLQQQLASTQAAARIAAARSNNCISNLRNALSSYEIETTKKLTQGQQQVHHLISLTKQLQSCMTGSNSSSSQQIQTITNMFQALAALGSLLTPAEAALSEETVAVAVAVAAATTEPSAAATPVDPLLATDQQLATIACISSQQQNSSLESRSTIQQAQPAGRSAEIALLQQRCDELQQQLQSHAHCAKMSHRVEVASADHLAKVAALEAEKLHLQQKVTTIQQSLITTQMDLQALRQQHHQQTSRLSDANARVLQLSAQLSKCGAELQQQQQQDAAAALEIVSCREVGTADCAELNRRRVAGSTIMHHASSRPRSAAAATELAGAGLTGMSSLLAATGCRVPTVHQQLLTTVDVQPDSVQYGPQQTLQQSWHASSSIFEADSAGGNNRITGDLSLQQQQQAVSSTLPEYQGFHTTTTVRPGPKGGGTVITDGICQQTAGEQCLRASTACGNMGQLQRPLQSSMWDSLQRPEAGDINGAGGGNGADYQHGGHASRCESVVGTTAADKLHASTQHQRDSDRSALATPPGGLNYAISAWRFTGAESAHFSASGGVCDVSSSASAMKADVSGGLTMVNAEDDRANPQQQLFASERHRALVAKADAVLARLAACRRAAMSKTSSVRYGGGKLPSAADGDGLNNNNCRTDSGMLSRLRCGTVGRAGTADACASAGNKQYIHAGLEQGTPLRRVVGARTLADARGVAEVKTQVAGSGVELGSGLWCKQGHSEAGQYIQACSMYRPVVQDLQEELDALEHDFAHAEAQLKAASARLSGRAVV